jgi:carbonic anhydrase
MGRCPTYTSSFCNQNDCGLEKFQDDGLRNELIKNPPKPGVAIKATLQGISFLPFKDPSETVRDDVAFLREHPLVVAGTKISGWIYKVESRKVEEVLD